MRGIPASRGGAIHPAQVCLAAIASWCDWPVELLTFRKISAFSGIRGGNNRPSHRRAKLRSVWSKERRAKRYVLSPCNRAIDGRKIFYRLLNPYVAAMELYGSGENHLGEWEMDAHRQPVRNF